MKLLLTGGAGYIGSHVLLCSLQSGHDVVVLENFSNSSPIALDRVQILAGKKITLYQGDVRDPDILKVILKENKIEAVLHFAGVKSVSESVAKPLNYYNTNFHGSLNILERMTEAGVHRFLFSSTASVYGDQGGNNISEDHETSKTFSPYARSKRMVEEMLEDLSKSNPRWAIAVLRYFNPGGAHHSGVIGEDPKGEPSNLLPYAMKVAIGKNPVLKVYGHDYPTPDGTGVRDYIHVMDLAEGHVAALDYVFKQPGYHIWNLGAGHGVSVMEMIQELEKVTGKSIPWKKVGRRSGDVAQCWADPSRAERDLGWVARRSLKEILTDHWNWQIQNPDGYERQ